MSRRLGTNIVYKSVASVYLIIDFKFSIENFIRLRCLSRIGNYKNSGN